MVTLAEQKRNRLITLCFVTVLLVLIYGPLAHWFIAADRIIYDRLATHLPNKPLEKALIVSVDPTRMSHAAIVNAYGKTIRVLREHGARRIIMTQPPAAAPNERLPAWVATLKDGTPVYVPSGHRYAKYAKRSGFVDIQLDMDGVLRKSNLWQLEDGTMTPSLSLAVAFDNDAVEVSPRLSRADDVIFLANYATLPRLDVGELLNSQFDHASLADTTVFLDASPELVGAAAVLPSGQFVTQSEITASMLADVEQHRIITKPAWMAQAEWIVPLLLAIIAVGFMPGRSRHDILVLTGASVAMLMLVETLMLYVLHMRIDLGRPILIFIGTAALGVWLVKDPKKATADAFKRGSDFLAAGRLEPAFAELRRCPPSETVATVLYKLSLAFEEQAKPERAEAVLDWMKRTQGAIRADLAGKNNVEGVPRRLGRYVIEKRIGKGAMGAVYLAKDPRINRSVALKVIPIAQEFEDEELKEARLRFYREAESAGRLTHPNIITVFDAGEEKGSAYIAMEYVPGIPLTKFTDPARLLAPKRALELAATTAEALDYAHNQGVIHRDIKPANLLYNSKEGLLKITDFGVARLTDNNRTKTGIVLGTPMYMSPEQLGAEDLTGHSDLFSLGVTLYELLVGEVPFKAPNIAVLMTKITTDDPPPVSSRRAGIPPSVDAVLAKALAKRPQDRFTCGSELAIALRNCARYA